MSVLRLPETCGVMPLPDCVLFPHGGLPLHIYEPRYRRMLADAIDGECMFAVTRLFGPESEDLRICASDIGTIGLIRAARESEDGTSHLLLQGLVRVRFTAWLADQPYPMAAIKPLACLFEPEDQAMAAASVLRASVEDSVEGMPYEVRSAILAVSNSTEDPVLLSDIVAQQFVGDPALRQTLLEMDSAAERIPLLCEYLRTRPTSGWG